MTDPISSTHSARPVHPVEPTVPAATALPRPGWLAEGETPGPAPRVQKDRRDTAAGCRDRATADLASALAASTANGRRVLETSAAHWTSRAELMERIETGIEARLAAAGPAQPRLTSAEAAEDAAYLRL